MGGILKSVIGNPHVCPTFELDGYLGDFRVSAQPGQSHSGFLLNSLAGGALRWTDGGRLLSEEQQQALDSWEET